MAPKSRPSTVSSSTTPTSKAAAATASSTSQLPQDVIMQLWQNYAEKTPQRVKLLDAFMAFLGIVGATQFLYCIIAGNYPFNAFLAGFSATVGQFVLTASLRIQTNPDNKSEFKTVSQERAFADFVLGSLILHFFCVNFIN
ncbi:MAG: oligosaccharyltransferase complex subunit epsilon [Stictis urceolatum]|nr:oligosaccharyltransferase complex subunit epsilon [Stictis urceolata]